MHFVKHFSQRDDNVRTFVHGLVNVNLFLNIFHIFLYFSFAYIHIKKILTKNKCKKMRDNFRLDMSKTTFSNKIPSCVVKNYYIFCLL